MKQTPEFDLEAQSSVENSAVFVGVVRRVVVLRLRRLEFNVEVQRLSA